jgi:ABC-type transport system substrate-binding protein
MLRGDPSGQLLTSFFGYQDLETAPWKDARVRQAMRMSVDWNAMRAYFSNSADFASAGIPVESRMAGFISGGGIVDYPYWLNPEKDELGEASKYFLYNLAEAKKLMQAAGFNSPVEIDAYQHNGAQYGSIYQEQGDITVDGWNKSGLFKANMNRLPYPQFLDQMYQKRDFKGIAVQQYDFVYNEVDLNLYNWYHSKGGRFHWMKGDTKLDDMIMKQRREIDDQKRTDIIHDIQKHMAGSFGVIPGDGTSGGFGFVWPAVRNSAWPGYKEFLDKTMPPLA